MGATYLANEYLPIIIFILIALGMGVAPLVLTQFLAEQKPDAEKLSAYECGFEAFEDSRMQFDVRFYLIAILFVIFDLESAFLFPWAIVLDKIGFFGFVEMVLFLLVLLVGYIYAWKKGALQWE
jgi:NADH-quinone oxidoreductase subunit A